MKWPLAIFLVSLTLGAQTLESQLKERREKSKGVNADVRRDMQDGIQDLRDQKLHERALKMQGKKIPTIAFKLEDGSVTELSSLYADGPVVLNFYRGGWCPYCMLELQSYQKLKGEFDKLGAQIIAIAPDTYKEIAKTKRKYNLDYLVVSDEENRIAKRMGIAFKVDPKTLQHYQTFGIDLDASQGNTQKVLPMPGVYVIDQQGIITYAFIDPDYTLRAEPSEVLAAVKKIGASSR